MDRAVRLLAIMLILSTLGIAQDEMKYAVKRAAAVSSGPAVPLIVQESAPDNTRATTVTTGGIGFPVTFPNATLANNTGFCAVTSTSAVTYTVTTDKSQTFSSTTQTGVASSKVMQLFYLANMTAGTKVITIQPSIAKANFNARCAELGGISNSSPLDAQAQNNATTTSTTAQLSGGASMTSGSSTSGDLAIFCAVRAGTVKGSTLTQGTSWNLFWADDYNGAVICEYQVASGTSVTPSMTWTSTTYVASGAMFTKASVGTAQSGVYVAGIDGVDLVSANLPTTGDTTVTFHQPTRSATQIIMWNGGQTTSVTDITDTPGNAWYRCSGWPFNNADDGCFYSFNATTSTSNVISLKFHEAQTTGNDVTVKFYQVEGLKTADDPFDTSTNNFGNDTVGGLLTSDVITPTVSKGIALDQRGESNQTVNTCGSSPFFLDTTNYSGQPASGPSTPDENNGWCHNVFSTNATITFQYNTVAGSGIGDWASTASTFMDPTSSRSGTWQEVRTFSIDSVVSSTSQKINVRAGDLIIASCHSTAACTISDSESDTVNTVTGLNPFTGEGTVQSKVVYFIAGSNSTSYTVTLAATGTKTGNGVVVTPSTGAPTLHTPSAGNHGTATASTLANASQSVTSGDFVFATMGQDALVFVGCNAGAAPWLTGEQRPDNNTTLGSNSEYGIATSTATLTDSFKCGLADSATSTKSSEGIVAFTPHP